MCGFLKKSFFMNALLWVVMIEMHTAGLDTIFVQIYMDAPPGVPGVSKELEGYKDYYLDVFLR